MTINPPTTPYPHQKVTETMQYLQTKWRPPSTRIEHYNNTNKHHPAIIHQALALALRGKMIEIIEFIW